MPSDAGKGAVALLAGGSGALPTDEVVLSRDGADVVEVVERHIQEVASGLFVDPKRPRVPLEDPEQAPVDR